MQIKQSNIFFPEIHEIPSYFLDGPRLPHQIDQFKVKTLLLFEVLDDPGLSDRLAQHKQPFQIATTVDDVPDAAGEVEAQEATDEEDVSEVKCDDADIELEFVDCQVVEVGAVVPFLLLDDLEFVVFTIGCLQSDRLIWQLPWERTIEVLYHDAAPVVLKVQQLRERPELCVIQFFLGPFYCGLPSFVLNDREEKDELERRSIVGGSHGDIVGQLVDSRLGEDEVLIGELAHAHQKQVFIGHVDL